MTLSPSKPTAAINKPAPRDFRQEVTDSIIRLMEEGTAPWQKPWGTNGTLHMPQNPTSQKLYRGGNALHLLATSMRYGFDDSRWMTYRQAAEQGWQVRKGEKGTQIEFWDVKRVVNTEADQRGTDEPDTPGMAEKQLIHRVYTVFNASQIEGVPALLVKGHTAFDAVEAGENILVQSGAKIYHDQGDKAFYQRGSDTIHLPRREYFPEAAGYYGTALHELAHWTGHPSRLNRPTLNETYQFGDVNYAKEELRAELASVFLAAERGIPHQPDRHAAYVSSWIKALKDDKNEIFRAATDAAKATDYLYALERGEEIVKDVIVPTESHVERICRTTPSGTRHV